jgi:hypothetical protein
MDYSQALLVQKEEVADYTFPAEEVDLSADELSLRNHAFDRAITLGNLEHHKVKIYFSDNNGLKVVDTTIWAVTEKYAVLKQGVVIPKHRIHKLEI